MQQRISRRHFLKTSAAAAAAGPFIASSVKAVPSERVRIGYIGCGGRARQLMPIFKSFANVDVVAISDVIEPRMDQAMEIIGKGDNAQRPSRFVEHERILERKDIDAVIIATTQHWHGLPFIQACQAGKHIFVEKPLAHTIVEGRAMVEARKKHGVIAMMGTQQRAGPHYQKAVEHIRSGRLGKVVLVECWNYSNTKGRTGKRPDSEAPAGYHWDRWLGPAPAVPFNLGRLDNSWWFDYGGGMLTNWAIHHIDIIVWAMQNASPTAVACNAGKYVIDDLADSPDLIGALWEFPGWQMQYRYRGFSNFHPNPARQSHHGITFNGSQATLVIDRSGYELWDEKDPKQVAEKMSAVPYFEAANPTKSEQDGPWQRLFVDCVKGSKKVPLDIEESHKGTVCCHLANISHFCGGRKLRWDAAAERVISDDEANRWLSRPRRKGYELPKV